MLTTMRLTKKFEIMSREESVFKKENQQRWMSRNKIQLILIHFCKEIWTTLAEYFCTCPPTYQTFYSIKRQTKSNRFKSIQISFRPLTHKTRMFQKRTIFKIGKSQEKPKNKNHAKAKISKKAVKEGHEKGKV